MDALTILLTVLFLVGMVAGIAVGACRKRTTRQARSRRYTNSKEQLDDVDEMFLWGEVTGDDFYR